MLAKERGFRPDRIEDKHWIEMLLGIYCTDKMMKYLVSG